MNKIKAMIFDMYKVLIEENDCCGNGGFYDKSDYI